MTGTAPFIHLRTHTAYSLLEGAIPIKKLPDLCRQHHMPAIGITDTNNMFGALEISMLLADNGIQPIIGCQLDVQCRDDTSPLVLLAQTSEGYQNLLKLVSDFYLQNWQQGAPLETICDRSDGVIVLAGSNRAGVLRGKHAEYTLDNLQKAFGNRLYIELQRHPQPYADEHQIVDWALERNIPLVATNDVYFAESGLFQAQDALLCIAAGSYVDQTDRRRLTPHHAFKSGEDMVQLFADVEEAVPHTLAIAQRCSFYPKPRSPMLPSYCADENEELSKRAHEGLEKRLKSEVFPRFDASEHQAQRDHYLERLEYELRVINNMGFDGYFLIVSDFIQWAKNQNIPVGPGRGSGAGSLVAWSTDITDMDPIRFQLIFERFLNPERVSMPDFDVDFCQDRRDEVIRYVSEKYGRDRVAHIITFGSLQARSTLRDVGRVLQMPYGQVDQLAKKVPMIPGKVVTLQDALKSEASLRHDYEEDDMVRHLFDIAVQLEGLYRHASTHAAGVVIGNQPLHEVVPLYVDERAILPATQFSMKYVEAAGLVKFDFLGLKTLTVIEHCCAMIRRKTGQPMRILDIPLDDAKTFELLGRVETVGVFQLEGSGMRDVLRQLKPDRFEDIIALVALYRPGPMDDIPRYLACKHGQESVTYLHPDLEPILSPTYGVMVYQEQVMKIAQVLGGYSMGAADLLRRAMGKKIKKEMDAQRDLFVQGAISQGVDKAIAETLFDQMAKFAGYGFNKSHASPYALLSYQTAYLKAHYPLEFYAANMSADMHQTEKLEMFYSDMVRTGIKLLPPCVQKSQVDFSVEDDAVRYGLAAIKNVGVSPMQSLVQSREEKGAFKNLDDFIKRVDDKVLNKRSLEKLITSGALDALHNNRAALWAGQDQLTNTHDNRQPTLFSSKIQLPNIPAWPTIERLQKEHEAIGFYISAHPLDAYGVQDTGTSLADVSQATQGQFSVVALVNSRQDRRTKNGQRFAFITLGDRSGSCEVAIFSDTLERYDDMLVPGQAIRAELLFKPNADGGGRVILQDAQQLRTDGGGLSALACHIEKLEDGSILENLPTVVSDEILPLHVFWLQQRMATLHVPKDAAPQLLRLKGISRST